ncbi:MAG: ATP-binding protein [Ignavibacteriales bacterium]|nr:ATP-binding protein [Ignavibacteriales bacterium]
MTAEELPRLFGRFVQLESHMARAHQGTGLGLALCRTMVELHGAGSGRKVPGPAWGLYSASSFP